MIFTRFSTIFSKEQNLPWICALISAFIACWVNYQARGVINNDGVLYLEVARLFNDGLWKQGISTYNWPFYPLLITLVHKASGLSFQLSANLLAVLFFSATSFGIATLIRDAGGKRDAMLAGVFLLIGSPYIVSDILPMVVRDHGYWATYIWSIVFFVRLMQNGSWANAIYWNVFSILCVLFRIEGIVYIAMLPLIFFTITAIPITGRLKLFFKANALPIFLGAGSIMALSLHPTLQLKDMGRLNEPWLIIQLVYEQLTHGLSDRSKIIATALGSFLDDYAFPTLLLGMAFILLAKAATIGGLLQSVLAFYATCRIKAKPPNPNFKVFMWLIAIGLFVAAIILVKGFVLPKRILAPIGLILIVLAAFAAELLIRRHRESFLRGNREKWISGIVVIVLLLQIAIALRPSPPQKRYERNAAEWVIANTPTESRIYFQTNRLRFYAGFPMLISGDWLEIQQSRWRQALNVQETHREMRKENVLDTYDFFIFSVNMKKSEEVAHLKKVFGEPFKTFEGPKGNRTLIFSRPDSIRDIPQSIQRD
jgi:hypothetical protein